MCKYCEKPAYKKADGIDVFIESNSNYDMGGDSPDMRIELQGDDWDDYGTLTVQIEYCPFCGRKL